jgi:hypothetical protein
VVGDLAASVDVKGKSLPGLARPGPSCLGS